MATYLKEKALKSKLKRVHTKRLKVSEHKTKEEASTTNEANCSFESLGDRVSPGTLKVIEEFGFKTMTEIQAKAIPLLLEGNHVRGTAKTGSGKTLAFLIPVVELIFKLRFKPRNGCGAIIISPTRELSMQTYGFLRELMRNRSQSIGLIIGGTHRKMEEEKLRKGLNILIATPGRLLDHLLKTQHFNYKNLACLVIDEADKIFEYGFYKDMKKIVEILPEYRQTMFFSATKDSKSDALARLFLKSDMIEVDVQSHKPVATVEGLQQSYLVCPADKRFLLLYTFMKKNYRKKVMIFFSSCMAVKFYHDLLNYINIPVMCIYGRELHTKRVRTFYQFCNSDSGILLCTSVAARGWDIPAVDWIVQYDPPEDPKEYIHRVGRTARAGGKGQALLFLTEDEVQFVKFLTMFKVKIDKMDIVWSEVFDVQEQLEEVVNPNGHLRPLAIEGLTGYMRAYDSHAYKGIFDVQKMDLDKVAKCFCLSKTPEIDFSNNVISVNNSDQNAKKYEGKKSAKNDKKRKNFQNKKRKFNNFNEKQQNHKKPKVFE